MSLQVKHDYKGHLWCGIGSLAAALEIPTSKAKQLIKSVSLRRAIKAVTYSEMEHALTAAKKYIRREYYPRNWRDCPTLSEWLESEYRPSRQVSVICITGHWIVVHNDMWVCSMNQTARHVSDCPYLKARVRHVVYFNRIED